MFDDNLLGLEAQTRRNLQANKQSNLKSLQDSAAKANAHIGALTPESKKATDEFQQHAQNCHHLPPDVRTGDTKQDAQMAEAYLLWRFVKKHHAGNSNKLSPGLKARYDALPKPQNFEKLCQKIHYPGGDALDEWVKKGNALLTRATALDSSIGQLTDFTTECSKHEKNYDTEVQDDPDQLQDFLTGLKSTPKKRLDDSILQNLKTLTCPAAITDPKIKKEVDDLIARISSTADVLEILQNALENGRNQKQLQEEYEWYTSLLKAQTKRLNKILSALEKIDAYKSDQEISGLHGTLQKTQKDLPTNKDIQVSSAFGNNFTEYRNGKCVDVTDDSGNPLEVDPDALEVAKKQFEDQNLLNNKIGFAEWTTTPLSNLAGLLLFGRNRLTFKNEESKAAFLRIYKEVVKQRLKSRAENGASAQGHTPQPAPGVSAKLQQWRQGHYKLEIVDSLPDDAHVTAGVFYICNTPNTSDMSLHYKVQDPSGNIVTDKIEQNDTSVTLTANLDLRNCRDVIKNPIINETLAIASHRGHTQPNSQIIPNTGNPHHPPAPTPAP